MNRRLDEILAYMEVTRDSLLAATANLNNTFASIRPHPGTWSVADILTHLATVEAGVARLVAKSVDWARAHGIGAEQSEESVMSSLDTFGVADPSRKLEAPTMVSPGSSKSLDESRESLVQSRQRLREALLAGADLDLSTVRRAHAVLGEINIYQWALFVAQHEERHRKQIERTIAEVTELAAECAPIV
jgi:uncharacterized damage-inducible protein DinB